jgi:hypothetical protein
MSSVEAVSKAIACLRVHIHGAVGRTSSPELNALVGKLINAFLESRWNWPRQFSQLSPYAFILSDPRTPELDKQALLALSRELQLKLFGVSGSGEVALLVFEGDEMEVHRFANLETGNLDKLMSGKGDEVFPPFDGQLSKLTSKGVKVLPMRLDEPGWEGAQPVSFVTPKFERNYEPLYRGFYFVPARRFFGNLCLCKPLGSDNLLDFLVGAQVLRGVPTEEFDEGCVESAAAALAQANAGGQLYVPLNFSSLVRPAGRKAYAEFLVRLPAAHKAGLVAAIYETPRDPSFFAMNQACKFLGDFFGQISLLVSDPAFEVEKLAPGLVSSVILILPDVDQPSRIAAIRNFMQQREIFKRRHILPGVWRVATRGELEACLSMRVPAISGGAISDLTSGPMGCVPRELENLPMRSLPGA